MIVHDKHHCAINFLCIVEINNDDKCIYLMISIWNYIWNHFKHLLPHRSHYDKILKHYFPQSLLMINSALIIFFAIAEMNCYDKCISHDIIISKITVIISPHGFHYDESLTFISIIITHDKHWHANLFLCIAEINCNEKCISLIEFYLKSL